MKALSQKKLYAGTVRIMLFILLNALPGCKSQQSQTSSVPPDPEMFVDEQNQVRYRVEVEMTESSFHVGNDSTNFKIKEATMTGNKLKVSVKYGGGCKMHEFKLVFPEHIATDTLQIYLLHLPSDDHCRAFVFNELEFDVTKISEKLQNVVAVKANNTLVLKK